MAKATRKIWGGAIEYEADDRPLEIRWFNFSGTTPTEWLHQSRDLHLSALAVHSSRNNSLQRISVALMLGSFAMETLLKMVIIGNAYHTLGNDIRRGEVAKSVAPTIHNLRKLLDESKLSRWTNIKDRDVLDRLTEFGVWKGRYPTPQAKKAETYSGAGAFDRGAKDLWAAYVSLYEKLNRIAFRKVFGQRRGGHPN